MHGGPADEEKCRQIEKYSLNLQRPRLNVQPPYMRDDCLEVLALLTPDDQCAAGVGIVVGYIALRVDELDL